nr:immunoglobulin light chain junction region [Macaca mulatta]
CCSYGSGTTYIV